MEIIKRKNIIACKNSNLSNIYLGIYFHGGTIFENSKVRGISHLLEHLIYRRLYDLYQRKLYKELNKLGIHLRGRTSQERILFSAYFLPDKFESFINIVLKIFKDFKWTDEEIFEEKEVVKRQIEEKGFSYFDYTVDENYLKGSILRNSISAETYQIDNLSSEIINDYKKRIFNIDNSMIILTGAFSDKDINLMESKLDSMEPLTAKPLKKQEIIPMYFKNRSSNNNLILANDYEDSEVEIRIDVSNEFNPHAIELLFYILAEGDGARLPYMLKDKLGYVGDIYASSSYYKEFGYETLAYSVDNSILIKTLEIIFEEFNNIKYNIKQEDLDEVINFSTNFSRAIDSSEILHDLIGYHMFELGKESFSIEDEIISYKKVTIEDLMETARKLFVSKNISIYAENNSRIERKYKVKNKLEELRVTLDE